MDVETTSSVYHIKESQNNDRHFLIIFLKYITIRSLIMGKEILHMGLQITVPYISHIKHTYNASSSISSLGFFFRPLSELKDVKKKKKTSSFYNFCLVPNLL